MGIKTKFCSMGGRRGSNEPDLGDLSLWRYSNDIVAGKTLLFNYTGNWYESQLVPGYAYVGEEYVETVYTVNYPPSVGMPFYFANGATASTTQGILFVTTADYFRASFQPSLYYDYFRRNASKDRQISLPGSPITLYVPKAKGKAIINDWISTTASGTLDTNRNTPFYNNKNIVNVDLQNVPFMNNSMYNTFVNCYNLKQVNRLSESIINMQYAFYNCSNLNQNIQIPNSVTNMGYTFAYCYNLKQNIKIPSSVTNMSGTFSCCSNLNYNIQIPSSLTYMGSTFAYCYNLNQNIQIPSSVTSMYYTFRACYNLKQNIKIPSSVTNMQSTFYGCYNLNYNIQIPSSVTNMVNTFELCYNLNQNIQIPSSVTNLYYTFAYCYNLNQNIKIPSSVTNMAYTFDHCQNLNQNIQIPSSVTSMIDTFQSCYNYKQNISNLCNGRTSLTTAYMAFSATGITNASHCFAGCTSLTNANAFQGCTSLTDISFTFERTAINQSIAIPASVTNMHGAFYYATALNTPITIPNGVVDMTYCFNGCSSYSPATLPSLSTSAKYAAYCFAGCSKLAVDLSNYCNGHTALTNVYYCFASSGIVNGVNALANISTLTYASHCFDNCRSLTNVQDTLSHCANLTTAENCFNNCTALKEVGWCIFESNKFTGNICFHATGITAANKIFSNNNSTRKNVYIYFTYANGVKTTTWNTFSTALWYYANGKANAKAKNILTNRRNCYVYNLGAAPEAGCILPDTKILMADGNTKDVQDIVITDLIQAYNQETGEFEPCRVTDVIPSWKSDILKIIMEDDTYIELTSGHSMLSERGWVACKPENVVKKDVNIEVSKLSIGDKILTKDGTYKVVKGIEEENLGLTRVYDLSIDKTHTYIANDLVQHNVISGTGS